MEFKSLTFESLLSHYDGDEEILREIAQDFIKNLPVLRENILIAIENNSSSDLEVAAHTLKGAAGNFLATDVMGLAAELEVLGAKGSLEGARVLWEKLDNSLLLLERELSQL